MALQPVATVEYSSKADDHIDRKIEFIRKGGNLEAKFSILDKSDTVLETIPASKIIVEMECYITRALKKSLGEPVIADKHLSELSREEQQKIVQSISKKGRRWVKISTSYFGRILELKITDNR